MIVFELTDEQRLIRETARDFADREIIPRARDMDRAGELDPALISKLGEIGFLGAIVDERYGGRGLDHRSYALIVEEVGRARFQLVQEMIADMVVETQAARALVWRPGWPKDLGRPDTKETSVARLYATEASVRCANTAIQVHGGSGYVDDHPVERYLRDARVTTLYEGTSQIQKLIIGRVVTDVNAMT